jgi:DNA-binding response OmpR family regulator
MAKILIVENNEDLRAFIKLLFEMNGFEVRSATTGIEVNVLLNTFAPDLILLDVMLHGENGRDICKKIKQTHQEIYIILISANKKSLVNYEECNADDVIEKPFNIDDILSKVKTLLYKKNKIS